MIDTAALAAASAHKLDAAVMAVTPTLMVPPRGGLAALPPLEAGRRRYLVAADGLWLEARSPALTVRWHVAEAMLPYGRVTPLIAPAAGPIPRALLQAFGARARAATPSETAALVLLNAEGTGYEIVHPPVTDAGIGTVSYREAGIDLDRLVIDMHSHGPLDAFFSPTDDASDLARQGPHISLVVGECSPDGAPQASAWRICCAPQLIPISARNVPVLV